MNDPKPTSKQQNVLGGALESCSEDPLTGFYRTGCCDTGDDDLGSHTVCAVMTERFLAFSREAGNDLSTPNLAWGFAGLKAGDRWCLCAARWQEALIAGEAPPVVLAATNERALEIVSYIDLLEHAVDPAGSTEEGRA
jgi:uncharacterized protein (DUF2237 family)